VNYGSEGWGSEGGGVKGRGVKGGGVVRISSTLERLEQFAKESRRGMENYVGASAPNVGVGWDRARKLLWVREWRRESFELPYYYREISQVPHRAKGFPPRATCEKVVSCKVWGKKCFFGGKNNPRTVSRDC
jgi:hypothetical protein